MKKQKNPAVDTTETVILISVKLVSVSASSSKHFHYSTCNTLIHTTLCLALPISTGLSFLLVLALLFTDYFTLFAMSSPTPMNSPNTPRPYAIIRRTVVIEGGKTHIGLQEEYDVLPVCKEPGCAYCMIALMYQPFKNLVKKEFIS